MYIVRQRVAAIRDKEELISTHTNLT